MDRLSQVRRGAAAALLWGIATALHGASLSDTAQAQAAALGTDLLSARMVAYCEAQAPSQAPGVRAAWQRWRAAFALDAIARQAGPAVEAQARQAFDAQAEGVDQRLAAKGPADRVCAQLPQVWSGPGMDLRREHPLAYGPAEREPMVREPAAESARAAAPAPSPATPPTTPAARQATVYEPAQLTALAEQWPAGPRGRERGPFYVKGTLRARGDHVFLEQNDGVFKSRLLVHPDIDLRSRVGQEVVLEGYLDRAPRQSPVQWKRTRVVADPSGLTPSPLPRSGLVREEVALDRVRAAPGEGLSAGQLSAVLIEGRATPGSSTRVQKLYYLLRDGSAYLRGELPPGDLDVDRSRALEPQWWARWRRAGQGWEIQRQDGQGHPAGGWQALTATAVSPWARGARPAGTYVKSSFSGSIALGGVHRRTSVTLGADGRFTSSRLAQGGSGAMAANGGFGGTASSHQDATGSRSSAGGGQAGVFAGSQSTRQDGADQRGHYQLDGYTVELRYDSGRVERGVSFPWGGDRQMVYWLDGLYLGAR